MDVLKLNDDDDDDDDDDDAYDRPESIFQQFSRRFPLIYREHCPQQRIFHKNAFV